MEVTSPRPRRRPRPVLHYIQRWLPLSEQYVHAVVSRSRHRGVVVSRTATENVAVFPFQPVRSLGRLLPPPRPFTLTERRLLTLSLVGIALRHDVRLVHNHHGYRLRDVEGLVRRRRLPWVASLHGHDATTHARACPWEYDGVFGRLDAVIVPSHWFVDHVVDLGIDPDVVHVVPAGVDTTFFAPSPLPDGPPEVLFVGRFVEKKGLDVLVEAWPHVRRAVPEARLTILGFGPLEALARTAGEGVVVETADPSRRAEQLRAALRRARVVVSPSRTAADGDAETLLLVNLEAQASGRPVVTTRHGGIPEYVCEDETAVLVSESDARGLAEAVVTVLRDDDLATRMGAAGPAWARRFDVAACTERIDGIYDALLR